MHLLGTCAASSDEARSVRRPAPPRSEACSRCCGRWSGRIPPPRSNAPGGGRRRRAGRRRHSARPVLRRLPDGWRPPDVPPAPRESRCANCQSRPRLRPVEFDWARETARHVGTVVHRELQRIAREGVRHRDRDDRRGTCSAIALELAELGVPEDRARRRRERCRSRAAHARRRARPLAALDHPIAIARPSCALTGRVGWRVVSVVIDRTFRRRRTACAGSSITRPVRTKAARLEEFLDREQAATAAAGSIRRADRLAGTGTRAGRALFPAAVARGGSGTPGAVRSSGSVSRLERSGYAEGTPAVGLGRPERLQ